MFNDLALLFEIKLQFAPPSRRANKMDGGSLGLEVSSDAITGSRNSPFFSRDVVTVNTHASIPSHRQSSLEDAEFRAADED